MAAPQIGDSPRGLWQPHTGVRDPHGGRPSQVTAPQVCGSPTGSRRPHTLAPAPRGRGSPRLRPARGGPRQRRSPPRARSRGQSRGRPPSPPPQWWPLQPPVPQAPRLLLPPPLPPPPHAVPVSVCVCVCVRPARPTAAAAPPSPLPSLPFPSLLLRRRARLNPRSAQRRGRDGGNPRAAAACAGRAGPGRAAAGSPRRRRAGCGQRMASGRRGRGRGAPPARLPRARRLRGPGRQPQVPHGAPGGCRASVRYADRKGRGGNPLSPCAPARPAALRAAKGRKAMLRRPLEGSLSLAVSELQLDSLRFIGVSLGGAQLWSGGFPPPTSPGLSQLIMSTNHCHGLPWCPPCAPLFLSLCARSQLSPSPHDFREMLSPASRKKKTNVKRPQKQTNF